MHASNYTLVGLALARLADASPGHTSLSRARQLNTTASAAPATVPSAVEGGVNTECKTCPYSLCTNVAAYSSAQDIALRCWTRGDGIVETNVWYKTTDECYVTEWDIIDGNYTSVLPYCGKLRETYTQGPSKTIFNTECNLIPEFVGATEGHTKMYKPETALTLTCKTNDGDEVLGDPTWYKTLSNCYVPAAQIEAVDAALDDCGPIPFMETKMRQPDDADADADAAAPPSSFAVRDDDDDAHNTAAGRQRQRRWLYLTQIGYDAAQCLGAPDSASKARRVYTYGDYIVVQCATRSENTADAEQIFLLTEDFCWVNDTLTDPQLIDSEIRAERYPNCNLFVDTEV